MHVACMYFGYHAAIDTVEHHTDSMPLASAVILPHGGIVSDPSILLGQAGLEAAHADAVVSCSRLVGSTAPRGCLRVRSPWKLPSLTDGPGRLHG